MALIPILVGSGVQLCVDTNDTAGLSIVDGGVVKGRLALTGYRARNVVTSLQAYTGSGTGTLTETSNGAWATQDGSTSAVGDIVFIQGGTTNLTDPKDSGPWQISSLGSAGSQWVLVRPNWFQAGMPIAPGMVITIGEGTLWIGTEWKAFCAVNKFVSVDDPTFYVGRVTQVTAGMTSGSIAVSNVGVRSLTKSQFIATMNTNGGTLTGTVGYGVLPNVTAPVAGYIGTASVTFKAIATAQAVQTNDTSTLNVTIINW